MKDSLPRRLLITLTRGMPASSAVAASRIVDRGVSSEGFIVQVHPAANAAETFLAIIAVGKFHCKNILI